MSESFCLTGVSVVTLNQGLVCVCVCVCVVEEQEGLTLDVLDLSTDLLRWWRRQQCNQQKEGYMDAGSFHLRSSPCLYHYHVAESSGGIQLVSLIKGAKETWSTTGVTVNSESCACLSIVVQYVCTTTTTSTSTHMI